METKLKSRYLQEFIQEITYNNRNPKDIKALSLMEDISTNPERIISPGEKLFRCRIIKKGDTTNQKKNFFGFDDKGSFVPPPESTRDLRANYRYIPYLYCANDPYIALVEVRPRFGANVSIATIEVKDKLTLLDFTNGKKPSKMTDAKVNLFSDLSSMFSKPVTDDDDITDYIPTQFIAEYAKRLDYDGIVFRSSLVPDINEHQLERYNISKESTQFMFTVTELYAGSCYLKNDTVYRFHLQDAFERIQMDLNNSDKFATFIMDELNVDTIKQIKAACHDFTVHGDFVKYKNLYQGVLIENSLFSPGIQLADYVAGVLNGYLRGQTISPGNYQYATDLYTEFIKPNLRQHSNGTITGYGVIDIPKRTTFRPQLERIFDNV